MLDKIIEQQEAIIRELQSAGYSINNNKERGVTLKEVARRAVNDI